MEAPKTPAKGPEEPPAKSELADETQRAIQIVRAQRASRFGNTLQHTFDIVHALCQSSRGHGGELSLLKLVAITRPCNQLQRRENSTEDAAPLSKHATTRETAKKSGRARRGWRA